MAKVSRDPTRRRLSLPEHETRLLQSDLFRLLGEEKEYRRVVINVLRPKWQAAGVPDDHPGRFDFGVLHDIARDETDNGTLNAYVDDVEYVVSETLRLVKDKKPAGWAAQCLHAAVAPPTHIPAGLEFVPGGICRWDRYDLPAGVESEWAFIVMGIQVSPTGARIHVPLREPIDIFCRAQRGKSEWLNFDRWDALAEAARDVLDGELAKLRWAFERRYATSLRNRATIKKDRREVLPALFRLLNHHTPPPPEVSRSRLRELAKRMEIDLPRKLRKRQKN